MIYSCPFPSCANSSDSITLLQVHCMSIHARDFVSCPWCTLPFSNLRVLQKHAARCQQFDEHGSHEGDVIAVYIQNNRCAPCESQFVSYDAAVKHYKEQHLNYRYVCEQCERCFTVYNNLERHYADGHPRAGTSAEAFSSPASPSITMPSSSTNADESTMPSVDNQAHSTRSTHSHPRQKKILSQLSRRELDNFRRAFRVKHCHECQIDFATVDDMTKHFKTDHKTKIHPCRQCNRMYMSRCAQRSHKCTKSEQSSAMNQRSPEFINIEPLVQIEEILSCPMLQCGFRTTSNQRFISHLFQNAHFPREQDVKLEEGAAIPADMMVKPEPTAYGGMREIRETTFAGSYDLTLDGEDE